MEIQISPQVQTAPIYDPSQHPSGRNPVFSNQGTVDVFLDDIPDLLNSSVYGTTPISGIKIAAGTGLQQVFSPRPLYARAAAYTTLQLLG